MSRQSRKDIRKERARVILLHLLPERGMNATEIGKIAGLTPKEVGWVARKLILEGRIRKEVIKRFHGTSSYYYPNL